MFCPQCQAEYLPHVRRCSDCDVPLVEHLPATHGDLGDDAVSGVAILKALGPIIAIPFVMVALVSLDVFYGAYPFVVQIVWIIGDTCIVLLFVFCDVKRSKGFSLREKAVQQQLPRLLRIHGAFLAVMVAGWAGASLVRHQLSLFRGSDAPEFGLILYMTGITIALFQIFIFRKILGRSLKHQK